MASMKGAREAHEAVRLPSGKVLVAGGKDATDLPREDVELYDPKRDRWERAGQWDARQEHQLVVLDDAPKKGKKTKSEVLALAGWDDVGLTARCFVWSVAKTWRKVADLPHPTALTRATRLVDGRVAVVGGRGARGATPYVQLWEPEEDAWASGPNLVTERFSHQLLVLNDASVVVLGGRNASGATAAAERWHPTEKRWLPIAPMPGTRRDHGAAVTRDGRVLVIGGWDDTPNEPVATTHVWDATTDRWEDAGTLPGPLFGVRQARLADGRVAVLGGIDPKGRNETTSRTWIWDDGWTEGPPLKKARYAHTVTPLDGDRVLVAGGFSGDTEASSEVWAPAPSTPNH